MKKFLTLFFTICLAVTCLTGFAACNKDDGNYINVYMPDGATALSLAYMMKNAPEINGQKIKYTVVAPNLIAAHVQNGDADMAIMPTNAAAGLYKQGVEYKYVAAMTHGNLFLIGEEADSLQDLKGSVVGCIGQSNVPDLMFQYLLKRNDIEFKESETPIADKVAIRYFTNGTLMRNMMAAKPNELKYGVLAAPDVANTLKSLDTVAGLSYQILFDLQKEWFEVTEEDKGYPELIGDPTEGYPQAGLFVKNSLDVDFVAAFLAKCKEGDEWENGSGWAVSNPLTALNAINANMPGSQSTIVFVQGKEVEEVLRCNIKTQTEGLKDYVEDFLKAIGMPQAALPDSGFYW